MAELQAFATNLGQFTPAMQIISDPDELRNYTVDGLLPRVTVIPETVEQVGQVVALANQQGLTLLTRGGGSRINLGGIPEQFDILLETTRLIRLLEHEAPDLTCHVEAGLTLTALQAQLATKGQRLALDPPDAQQATLGGIVASNASGPKRLRYGTARDMVMGLHVVQANGDIARSGGRVVKNVAGYDLNKLYIGSLGTLGIIVEANFKLQPLPANEHTLILTFSSAADAMQTVIAILGSLLTPSAIELIDPRAANDMTDFFGLNLPTNGYTLAVNFEGSSTAIDRQIEETCRHYELDSAVVAHAGNGILYIELRPSDATPRLVEAIAELRLHAQGARGSLVVERCPIDLKRRIDVWGESGADFYLMQRLKQQFDPKGTFVKGRFVGGL